MSPRDRRVCQTCGRAFTWRKAWARDWDAVRHCSAGCRRSRPDRTDRALEAEILAQLSTRARGATVTPSEVAQAAAPDRWRPLIERTRRAARRLAARGEIELLQGGRVISDPSRARGPLWIRRRDSA